MIGSPIFLSSIVTTVLPRLKALLGERIDLSCIPEKQVAITVELPARHLAVRNLRMILEGRQSHREFTVPEVIAQSDDEIIREFLQGFADVSGNIRRSNYDRNGFHRVYLKAKVVWRSLLPAPSKILMLV